MPSKSVQTVDPQQRPRKPCRICQMQLRLQRLYTAYGLFNIWVRGRWAPKARNIAFWYVVSVSAIVGSYVLADELYCGRGRQRVRGRHVWEREAAIVTDIMQCAGNGSRRLAAWFRERCSFSRLLESIQQPEVEPEPESKPVVKPNKTEAKAEPKAEPEADDDYDFCELHS